MNTSTNTFKLSSILAPLLVGMLAVAFAQGSRSVLSPSRDAYQNTMAQAKADHAAEVQSMASYYEKRLNRLNAYFTSTRDAAAMQACEKALADWKQDPRFSQIDPVREPDALRGVQQHIQKILNAAETLREKREAQSTRLYMEHLTRLNHALEDSQAITTTQEILLEIDKIQRTVGPVSSSSARPSPPTSSEGVALPISSLLLYYDFSRNMGPRVMDMSSRGAHGRISGASWTDSGRFGGVLQFDGENDYLDASAVMRTLSAKRHTISLWFNPERSGGRHVLASQDSSTIIAIDQGRIDVKFTIGSGGGRQSYETFSSAPLGDAFWGNWHHLAYTFEQGVGATAFIDGEQVGSTSERSGIGIDFSLEKHFYIGKGPQGNHYKGLLDGIAIFDRALSQEEIRALITKQTLTGSRSGRTRGPGFGGRSPGSRSTRDSDRAPREGSGSF